MKYKFIDGEFDFLYEDYDKALKNYLYVYNRDSANANVCYRIGICYLNLAEKHRAIPFLEKAALNTTDKFREGSFNERAAPKEALINLGNAYRIDLQLDKAVAAYELYRKSSDVDNVYGIEMADHEIEKCYVARKYIRTPLTVEYINLDLPVNDESDNINASVTSDDSILVYTNVVFRDLIYYCVKNRDGTWSEPDDITFKIKSSGFYSTVNISNDGKRLILYSGDHERGDLYHTTIKGNKWQVMEKFNKKINSKYKETSACFSPDEKILYFASNRKGGYGGLDLYKSEFIKGDWAEPVNLGPTINTPHDENYPNILDDGITLYFASQGHTNMGGYDIFYSKFQDDHWTTPLNVGFPVSTTDDDIYFKPIKNGEIAYISRYDKSSLGGFDIYRITIKPGKEIITVASDSLLTYIDSVVYEHHDIVAVDTGALRSDTLVKEMQDSLIASDTANTSEVTVETNKVTIIEIRGTVRLKDGNDLDDSFSVTVVSQSGKDTLTKISPLKSSGEYSLKTIPGNYKIIFAGNNYETHSEFVSIPDNYSLPDIKVNADLTPKEVSSGEYYVIRNIYFDFDARELNRESKIYLEKIYKALIENPGLYVEVIGHTDAKGTPDYNRKLSIKRARAVIEYLVDKGIDSKLFISRGMGEEQQVARNFNPDGSENPEGMRYNRRVEIKLYISDSTLAIVDNTHIPEHLRYHEDELSYTVMLTTTSEPLKEGQYSNFTKHEIKDGYIYTAGTFNEKSEAITFLNALDEARFPEAKIISTVELQNIIRKKEKHRKQDKSTQDMMVHGQDTVVHIPDGSVPLYVIQISTSPYLVDLSEEFKGIEQDRITVYKGSDGYYRYTYGEFEGFTTVKRTWSELMLMPQYEDAFIMNKENYSKLSVVNTKK